MAENASKTGRSGMHVVGYEIKPNMGNVSMAKFVRVIAFLFRIYTSWQLTNVAKEST